MIRTSLKFLPAGITASPACGRESRDTILVIGKKTYWDMRRWAALVRLRGENCYLDFMHREDGVVAFDIDSFIWQEDGIYCKGRWSKLGEALAVRGKITGTSVSLPVRGLTFQAAKRWLPHIQDPSGISKAQQRCHFGETPGELPPVVCEPFVPDNPWPCVGTVAVAPTLPSIPACRFNALVTTGELT
jgi:hypothetical protein